MPNALNIDLRTRPFPQHLINFTLHLFILEHIQFRECTTSLIFEKGVDAPVNTLNTRALVEHETEDFRENTHPLLRQPGPYRHSGAPQPC